MPIIGGVVGYFSANHLADQSDETGAQARNLGLYGARAIRFVRNVDSEHDVTGKVKDAAGSVWQRSKQLNEEHDITGKAKDVVLASVAKASELNERYHVTDRAAAAVSTGLSRLAQTLENSRPSEPAPAPKPPTKLDDQNAGPAEN
mmetsp:Transcript_16804/g.47957  ORF Transcript_16804/g.47957 Transcript_16804/m.47957 type:complete len:146 (-) Transcript_16804:59-496(-)